MRKWLGAAAAAAAIIGFIALRVGVLGGPGHVTLRLGDAVVRAEVARTEETRQTGLGGRTSLAEGEGMLFVFDAAAEYSFWMKGMMMPIDIIWLRAGAVVDVAADVWPDPALPTYRPRLPAEMVLEVPAGFAVQHGIRPGMAAGLDGFRGFR